MVNELTYRNFIERNIRALSDDEIFNRRIKCNELCHFMRIQTHKSHSTTYRKSSNCRINSVRLSLFDCTTPSMGCLLKMSSTSMGTLRSGNSGKLFKASLVTANRDDKFDLQAVENCWKYKRKTKIRREKLLTRSLKLWYYKNYYYCCGIAISNNGELMSFCYRNFSFWIRVNCPQLATSNLISKNYKFYLQIGWHNFWALRNLP